jgi:hypothetical protein
MTMFKRTKAISVFYPICIRHNQETMRYSIGAANINSK